MEVKMEDGGCRGTASPAGGDAGSNISGSVENFVSTKDTDTHAEAKDTDTHAEAKDTDTHAEAESYRVQGNKHFAAKEFLTAKDMYTAVCYLMKICLVLALLKLSGGQISSFKRCHMDKSECLLFSTERIRKR
jgi:hypothetical protein